MGFSTLRTETISILRHLADYHSMVESRIEADKQNETEELNEVVHQSDDPGLFAAEADDLLWVYESYFPRFLRYSLIVTLVMVMESQLIKICDDLRLKRNLRLKSKDLKGDTFSQCKRYLEEIAQLPLKTSLWEGLADLLKVRNCIVHTMGNIESSNDKNRLCAIAKTGSGLSLGSTVFTGLDKNIIYLSPEYCERAIMDVIDFFDDIFNTAGYGDSFV
jgi:hypothetical protein